MCYSLDAGPNIHLIYHEADRSQVVKFVETELIPDCENGLWIDDHVGHGPTLIQSETSKFRFHDS